MTPKEKAIELAAKFMDFVDYEGDDCLTEHEKMRKTSKICALIAVDEIIKDRERLSDSLFYDLNYWIEVRTQIQDI